MICFVTAAFFVVPTLSGQAGSGRGAAGSGAPGGGTSQGRSGAAIDVVEMQSRTLYTTVAGRLHPAITVPHVSTAAGTVTAVHVGMGQRVAAGVPLFTIERDAATGSFAPVVIRSRVAGTVSRINVQLHHEVRNGETGVVIMQPSEAVLTAFVSDKDVSGVTLDSTVEAVDPRGQVLPGRLVAISPEPDYQTGLFELQFVFPSADGWAGRFVTVGLPVDSVRGVFVSRELLVRRYGQYYLWSVTDEDRLRLQRVSTGITVGDEILITDGLEPGDRYLQILSGREAEGAQLQPESRGN
ncbi:efflux RND transporter periplasmic adaptor subunit [Spirochaeta africana]|uniref:Multidrug resistance protein MdtA-like C-terminal permuted SH3 domain-containing protein n=1 Tax=Spirochaeta africana (strain ATCC 700263 / DSM 8902 / Z-7692) TaxID=889378 RepID=H9UM77_SPIAZ|nr:HlyD family efflux transporter periplasmic adaptor subunit [Spirochaeta africana]AFG38620.1 hypothetical protein Spiaf_2590 [Spirochaeta africana DSM 8902]